jgi:competence protein ComGC
VLVVLLVVRMLLVLVVDRRNCQLERRTSQCRTKHRHSQRNWTNGQMDRQTNGQTDEQTDERTDGQTVERTQGTEEGAEDQRKEEQTNRATEQHNHLVSTTNSIRSMSSIGSSIVHSSSVSAACLCCSSVPMLLVRCVASYVNQ